MKIFCFSFSNTMSVVTTLLMKKSSHGQFTRRGKLTPKTTVFATKRDHNLGKINSFVLFFLRQNICSFVHSSIIMFF